MKKNITIIFTGGTISMEESIDEGTSIKNGQEQVLKMSNSLSHLANIKTIEYKSVPSPHITINDMFNLKEMIEHEIKLCDGIVITHGTDTLEESAYFTDITVDSDKPIVFIGSMRNVSNLGFDGPSNLAAGIKVASSEYSKNRGVLVVMNDVINAANEVTKTHTSSLDTFKSLEFGALGVVDGDSIIFYRNSINKEKKYHISNINSIVPIVKCFTGMDSGIIDYYIDKNVNSLVIEGFGRGNVPPSIVESIKSAINKDILVIISSRCPQGRVKPTYSYLGGSNNLKELGAIMSNNLSSQKIRIKLIVLNAFFNDNALVKNELIKKRK